MSERESLSAHRRFRKKPVVVEAFHYTGANWPEAAAFMGLSQQWIDAVVGCPDRNIYPSITLREQFLVIKTLEGDMTALAGDWIIKGVKGEFYPCKPDIFDETYEAVS